MNNSINRPLLGNGYPCPKTATLSPTELLEQKLNAWYDQKEQREQARQQELLQQPDKQFLLTDKDELTGETCVYQITVKLIRVIQGISTTEQDALELDEQELEMEVNAYVS